MFLTCIVCYRCSVTFLHRIIISTAFNLRLQQKSDPNTQNELMIISYCSGQVHKVDCVAFMLRYRCWSPRRVQSLAWTNTNLQRTMVVASMLAFVLATGMRECCLGDLVAMRWKCYSPSHCVVRPKFYIKCFYQNVDPSFMCTSCMFAHENECTWE